MNKYDALYIFVGISRDEALDEPLAKALAEVERVGGKVLATDPLGRRAFSRPMKKRDSGMYVKVRLELDPLKVDELVKRYQLVEEVFRVQILAVDERREALIARERTARAEREAKKMAAQGAAYAAANSAPEAKAEEAVVA